MADFWYAMPKLKEGFASKEEMCKESMRRSKCRPWIPTESRKYKMGTSIRRHESSPEALAIDCELGRNLVADDCPLARLDIYNAIRFFDLPGPAVEIVYIGRSLSSTLKRLRKHNRWGEISSEKTDQDDLLVYFCELKGSAYRFFERGNVAYVLRVLISIH